MEKTMFKPLKVLLLSLLLVSFLVGSTGAESQLVGDLDGNYKVNFEDLRILCAQIPAITEIAVDVRIQRVIAAGNGNRNAGQRNRQVGELQVKVPKFGCAGYADNEPPCTNQAVDILGDEPEEG